MLTGKRFEELDSIRGLAATSVIMAHLSIILPFNHLFEKISYTPLHFFWLGHESVILFFVLSGFVLSLPYHLKKAPKYKGYLIRRLCRILIPSVTSLFIAIFIIYLLAPKGLSVLSEWGNQIWTAPISYPIIFNHLVLLSEFDTMTINPVIWSLIHEMRISILFPFIMLLMKKNNSIQDASIVFSIPILYFLAYYVSLTFIGYDLTTFSGGYSSYLLTPHYIAFFMLGAALAKYRESIGVLYRKLKILYKLMLLIFGITAYMFVWLVFPNYKILHLFIINDWAIAIGCSIFIVASLHSKKIKYFLMLKVIQYLGKISYSLYLYHMIVILTLIYVLHGLLPVGVILVISFLTSFLVASLMYYAVEYPSIKLGKILTRNSSKTAILVEKKVSTF